MQVHVAELLAAMQRQGHAVRVVAPGVDDTNACDGARETASGGRRAAAGIVARFGALRHRLPAWMAELLELGYSVPAYLRLRRAARARTPDVIYERYNLFLLAGVWLKRSLGVPLLLEVNAPLAEERAAHGRLSLTALARWSERFVWRRADVVLPVSHALAAYVRAAGVPDSRIAVIPNGVRPEVYAARDGDVRADLGLDDGRVVFGFVGFIRPWHGLERVLDVIAGLDDRPHLLVVGEGPARPLIEQRANALGLADRVTITGAVPHARVPAYLRAFDVALQPDVTAYASPLKLFEYMAAGCAIVAPDRPNIREIVTDGETAVLVDPSDDAAFAAVLSRLAADTGLRRRLGRAAAVAVKRDGRTWESNARRVIELGRLCARRTGGGASAVLDTPAGGIGQ
nr:glycosyltransferase family 4 protein [Rhodovibrio salinarum]